MPKKSAWLSLVWIVVGIVSLAYLANFTFGVIEVLPDNLPLVGNVDEGVATLGLLGAIAFFTKINLVKIVAGGK